MQLTDSNKLNKQAATEALLTCCGSSKWASLVMIHFPFRSVKELVDIATIAWYDECKQQDWLEAFTHHPKIGDLKSLEEKFASSKQLAGAEQAGVNKASSQTIEALAKGNADYEEKFGFIFIVCATGKTAAQMLRLLQDRLKNSKEEELHIAMGEQHKITILRLKKILSEEDWQAIKVSQLTTHVLDSSIGKPGENITIRLKATDDKNEWKTIAQGVTNADGRIGDLLPLGRIIDMADYKIVFETKEYFEANKIKGFYPKVEIDFTIFDEHHYHVPLLINPFGYSTYRGS